MVNHFVPSKETACMQQTTNLLLSEKTDNNTISDSQPQVVLYKLKPAPYPGMLSALPTSWVSWYAKRLIFIYIAFQLRKRAISGVSETLKSLPPLTSESANKGKLGSTVNVLYTFFSRQPPSRKMWITVVLIQFKVDSDFQIPRFRVTDDSDVEVKELASQSEIASAHSSSTMLSFEGGVWATSGWHYECIVEFHWYLTYYSGGGAFGFSAAIKAGHASSSQDTEADKTSSKTSHIYVSYNVSCIAQ